MIKLELDSDKTLKVTSKHPIFVGENNFDTINIQLITDEISGHDVSDCDFVAHVVFPDQSYIEYELTWDEAAAAEIPISRDLTGTEQKLKIFVKITADDDVVGNTSSAELIVENVANEARRITTFDELIEILANITDNKLIFEDLGTTTDSSVFDNNIDPKKVYSVMYNGVCYRFFLIKGTTIQYRMSGNGIDARSTTESTWTSLTNKDSTPTENSLNLITSGAVFAALAQKLNFEEVSASISSSVFDEKIDDGVLYKGFVVDKNYFWITLTQSSLPLFQYRFSSNGIEMREYRSINSEMTWTSFRNITDNLLGLFSDTDTLVTEAALQTSAYKNPTKDYYIRLAADVLFTGQTAGLGIRLINVNNTQYALTDGEGIYYRQGSNTWQSIS